jgi:hypothetical protein
MKKFIFLYLVIFFFNISHAVEKSNLSESEKEIQNFFMKDELFNKGVELLRIPATICDNYDDKCHESNLSGRIGIFDYNSTSQPYLRFLFKLPHETNFKYWSFYLSNQDIFNTHDIDCMRTQLKKAKEWADIAKKNNAEVSKRITSEHIGCDTYPPLFVEYNKLNKKVKIAFLEWIPDRFDPYDINILLNMSSFNKLKKFIEKDLTHHENEAMKIINKENETDALFN